MITMETLGWLLALLVIFYYCKNICGEEDTPELPRTVIQDVHTYDETYDWNPRKPKILDLHGYRVKESMVALKVGIAEVGRTNNPYLRVKTGKGIHSRGGIPKIRPAVTKYLDKTGIPYKWQPGNEGVLTLKATPNNRRKVLSHRKRFEPSDGELSAAN